MVQTQMSRSVAGRVGTASGMDAVRVAAAVGIPTVAKGVLRRRPHVLAVAQRMQFDRWAIGALQGLRARHGADLVLLRLAGRQFAVVLDPAAVQAILAATPAPYSPATREKRAALRHFQPHGVLITAAAGRPARRSFNEAVLQPDRRLHALAGPIAETVAEEMRELRSAAHARGYLDWAGFAEAWWRIVRSVVLGRAARADSSVTGELAKLRDHANWACMHPADRALRERFQRRVRVYLDHAEAGTLGALVRATSAPAGVDPDGQVPHWLFAFDAARIASYRAAAVLAAQPERAREAATDAADAERVRDRPYLRACMHESVRLWPTTPLLLRESTEPTSWGRATVAPGTTFAIFTPFFHRDPERLPWADEFCPSIWLDGTAEADPALVPFSSGPAVCPAENLVLFMASTVLAHLVPDLPAGMPAMPQLAERTLPSTVDHFRLRIPVRGST